MPVGTAVHGDAAQQALSAFKENNLQPSSKADRHSLNCSSCSSRDAALSMASAQRRCQLWLTEQIKSSPHRSTPKMEMWEQARGQFPGLSRRGFDAAWAESVRATGATKWSQPGRKKTPPDSENRIAALIAPHFLPVNACHLSVVPERSGSATEMALMTNNTPLLTPLQAAATASRFPELPQWPGRSSAPKADSKDGPARTRRTWRGGGHAHSLLSAPDPPGWMRRVWPRRARLHPFRRRGGAPKGRSPPPAIAVRSLSAKPSGRTGPDVSAAPRSARRLRSLPPPR
ncbi:hypothetical protein MPC1_190012 [Methylocella tundrae]|nr:hypothetical protein MPC1_190012 [Methylocella tundrae]